MANRLGLSLQQKIPISAGARVYHLPLPSSISVTCARNRSCGYRNSTSRRLVLGIGAGLWAQFMSMAGNIGGKSFIASARQKGEIEQVLKNVDWPEQFPFKEEDFQRFDESPDTSFYEAPRFVTHIDDPAIAALTKYYSEVFPPSNTPVVVILDMCSSWVSHFPAGYKQDRIVGMGMNEEELKRNPLTTETSRPTQPLRTKWRDLRTLIPKSTLVSSTVSVKLTSATSASHQFASMCLTLRNPPSSSKKRYQVLTEYVVQDLNINPKLPFEDNSFDVITNVVSVDYLTKPIDVFKEMCRILKPGGLVIMSFSNRCFWTKAISIWTSTGDAEHVMIVGSYFHYAGGYEPPQAMDISPNPGRSDPMYIVYSKKLASA
ncbi:S-adenosyl-L-methionine-dependent methyltransferases superfamily protein [Actinidia rufa]|uniref:S-adenosyl-L-methionine-dependent methyltransferases superfamily protein n=1 Tax=Actinidia rufa TaxID=165716 RepID=A0A7J0FIC3_9ERIC|nr:S-adenosyl-L-methionine-dependent methyltransferases superfamily protein [Actinidia rufa]